MTGRDRVVVVSVLVIAVLGAGWMLVVSPRRQQAGRLSTQVAEAKKRLSSAQEQLAQARAAQARYAADYASVVSLGKAVPATEETPSLIYQLSQASDQKNVEFASIAAATNGSGASSSASPGAPAPPSPTPTPSATSAPASAASSPTSSTGAAGAGSSNATAGFTQMPFTFVFDGSFFDLEHLFGQLDHFVVPAAGGGLQVSGRLLTVQSVKLAPVPQGAAGGPGQQAPRGAFQRLTGTITATAYVLPAGQGLTGGATAISPAGATPTAVATTASSPTAPAVAKVTP